MAARLVTVLVMLLVRLPGLLVVVAAVPAIANQPLTSSDVSTSQVNSGIAPEVQPSSIAGPAVHTTSTVTPTIQPSSNVAPSDQPTTEDPAGFEADCGLLTTADGFDISTVGNPEDMPWLVTLQGPPTNDTWRKTVCTAVVVSDRWILGSVNCPRPGHSLTARSIPREPNGTFVEFDINGTVHYSGVDSAFNLPYMSLYKTSSPILPSSGVQPICLPDGDQIITATASNSSLMFSDITYDWSSEQWQFTGKPDVFNVTTEGDADCIQPFTDYEEWFEKGVVEGNVFCIKIPADPALSPADVPCPLFMEIAPVMGELTVSGAGRWFIVGMRLDNMQCVNDEGVYVSVDLGLSMEWIKSVISQK